VRTPAKAGLVRDLGCEIVRGDLSDEDVIRASVTGCDAVFHIGAMYEVGIPDSERPVMYEANVEGTARVLDAGIEAGVGRIVYVSTVGVFGDTKGRVVDETYEREPTGFMSYYEETKYLAHELARDRIGKGGPVVIVQPGGIYGPGDPSIVGTLIGLVRRFGLPFMVFPDAGFNFVHVDDVAEGILLAHDKGRIGESYVLGGEIVSMREALERICRISGKRVPRWILPASVLRLGIPFGPVIGRLTGFPPNLRELLENANATFYATDQKARTELGYTPRDIDTGLTETFAAMDRTT
jgi:nucleoside-diphosphate-sugar epimerase